MDETDGKFYICKLCGVVMVTKNQNRSFTIGRWTEHKNSATHIKNASHEKKKEQIFTKEKKMAIISWQGSNKTWRRTKQKLRPLLHYSFNRRRREIQVLAIWHQSQQVPRKNLITPQHLLQIPPMGLILNWTYLHLQHWPLLQSQPQGQSELQLSLLCYRHTKESCPKFVARNLNWILWYCLWMV